MTIFLETTELVITNLSTDGRGIARDSSGMVVMVLHALPGEQVRVNIIKKHKNFSEGVAAGILSNISEHRIEPSCVYASQCGGCQLQHINIKAQRVYKQQWLLETLRRVGQWNSLQIDAAKSLLTLVEADFLNYRQRIRLHLRNNFGFVSNQAASDKITNINTECAIASGIINQNFAGIYKFFTAYDADFPHGLQAEITASNNSNLLTLSVFSEGLKRQLVEKTFESVQNKWQQLPFANNSNDIYLQHPFVSNFIVNKNGFLQGHLQATQLYCTHIVEVITNFLQGNPSLTNITALDLYCGAGLFSMLPNYVAQKLQLECSTYAVEGNAHATLSATKNLRDFKVKVITKNVVNFISDMSNLNIKPHIAIIDPPREGTGINSLKTLSQNMHACSLLIMVSCSPAAFARDALILFSQGYALSSLNLFDTFAQTHHYEIIASFTRNADV